MDNRTATERECASAHWLTGRLKALDTCAVSDALDFLGITGATIGIRPMSGPVKITGHARTVEAVDAAAGPAGRHLGTQAVASFGPGDVIVVANRGARTSPPGATS